MKMFQALVAAIFATLIAGTANAVEITTERYGFRLKFDDPNYPDRWTKSYNTECGDEGERAIQFSLDDTKTFKPKANVVARSANIRICAQIATGDSNALLAWCSSEYDRFKTTYSEGLPMHLKFGSEEFALIEGSAIPAWGTTMSYGIYGQNRKVENICIQTGKAFVLVTMFNQGWYQKIDGMLAEMMLPGFQPASAAE